MRARLVALVLSFLVLPFAIGQDLGTDAKKEILDGVKKVLDERAFVPGVDLTKWSEHVTKHQESIDKATTIDEFSREVNRALREFGFSHIRLRTPRLAETRGRTFVVGPGFNARFDEKTLIVTNVTEKSPAAEAGLKVGDIIIEVDGKAPETADVLRGDEGTELTLKVKSDPTPKEVKVKRQRISTVRAETLTWQGEDTAVLRIFTFSAGYGRQNIENLIKEANEKKAKYLILDLRSNGGGAVNNLQHLLSLLLPPDTVVGSFINKATAAKFVEVTKGDPKDVISVAKWSDRKYKTQKREVAPFSGKIAVLINRASASASEICSAALRENAKAVLIGTRTAGAVLASTYAKLPQGFEMQYPVSDFVTANGMRLEANPLVPDAEVTGRTEEGKDPVVEKALELLRKAG